MSQKIENQLNLALDATEAERQRSRSLNVGYDEEENEWELILKYSGSLEPVRELAVYVTELTGGYVIIQIKESRIEELAAQYEVEKFVVGLPKNMNATEGERAEKSRAFADALFRRTGIEVVMWDERLTTVAADRTMMEAGIRREDRKEYVDAIAASYILQGYLDYLQNRKA